MLAGMNVAAGPKLAAAVTNAGGLGVIGGVGYTPDMLREQVAELLGVVRVDPLAQPVGGLVVLAVALGPWLAAAGDRAGGRLRGRGHAPAAGADRPRARAPVLSGAGTMTGMEHAGTGRR